jgi:hypothetical protein
MTMRRQPENVAALVNLAVVLLLPTVAASLLYTLNAGDASVTVRPPGWSPAPSIIAFVLGSIALMLPFALLAFWRTHVHAKRWISDGDRGWRGVGEAGLTGFAIALFVLRHGIATRPMEAGPYIVVYGGGAFILGLLVGLLLRTTAVVALKLARPAVS